MSFKFLSSFALAMTLFLSAPQQAHAETLSGQDAINLMVAATRQFDAGSRSDFKADGTYSFAHGNGTDTGTYKVKKNGQITLDHTSGPSKGKRDVFVVEQVKGRYQVRYVQGRWKGNTFQFK